MRKLIVLSLMTACSSENPAPPADVQKHITDDLAHILHETSAASDGSTANAPDLSVLSKALGLSTMVTVAPAISKLARLAPADPPTATDQLIQELNDQLFIDANYVGNGVYTVPPSLVCPVDANGVVDADCAQKVTEAQLRIHVTEDDTSLRFAIQLDANHDEPLALTLTHDSLAETLSLDDAGRAIAALAPIFGAQAPNASLAGQVTSELDILGSAHAKASVSIDRDISIKLADQGVDLDGPDAVRFSSAAAQVIALELDGNAPLAKLDVDVHATTAHVPVTTTDSNGVTTTDTTDLALGGISATVQLDRNGLALSNLGLGDSTTTLAKNGQQALSIDLNPDDGRRFAVAASVDSAGVSTVTVTPKLDVRMSQNHAVLGDTPPEYDVTQLLVVGSLQSTATGAKVVDGEYKLVTNPASFGIDATAGQCVSATDTFDSTTGNDYTQWSVGACQ